MAEVTTAGGVRTTSMKRSYRSPQNIAKGATGSLSYVGTVSYYTNYEIDYCNMLFSGPGAE